MLFPTRPAPVLTVRASGRFTAPSCSAQHHWPTILELVAHCGHAKKPGDESRSMKLLIAGDNSPFQETILEAVARNITGRPSWSWSPIAVTPRNQETSRVP